MMVQAGSPGEEDQGTRLVQPGDGAFTATAS